MGGSPAPAWASWTSELSYLPIAFHSKGGPASFSGLITWLREEPFTTKTNVLASYHTVEIVALAIGLALRDLAAIQFQEDAILPAHLVNSPLTFRDHEALSDIAGELIKGWVDE